MLWSIAPSWCLGIFKKFLSFRILNNLRLPWKTECALNWVYWIYCILFIIQNFKQLSLTFKIRVCPEFTVLHIHFLSCRIFNNLRLPWKRECALNSLYWIYISSFRILNNLHLPWKTECALNSLYWYFLLFRILNNLRLPWNTDFVLNFSSRGGCRPPTSYATASAYPKQPLLLQCQSHLRPCLVALLDGLLPMSLLNCCPSRVFHKYKHLRLVWYYSYWFQRLSKVILRLFPITSIFEHSTEWVNLLTKDKRW